MSKQRAFPHIEQVEGLDRMTKKYHPGMDLRDYFAAKAMNGIIGNSVTMRELTKHYESGKLKVEFEEGIANLAYVYADAMMEARKQ